MHPYYLDVKGLIACWREALLAKAVLLGSTRGYRNHPQLERFKRHPAPIKAINSYLRAVYSEARGRGYNFQRNKCGASFTREKIRVTRGQLEYEMVHLKKKVMARDKKCYSRICNISAPLPNPIFKVSKGAVETWEKVPEGK